jgi:predicted DNA-binding transcriptional regulator
MKTKTKIVKMLIEAQDTFTIKDISKNIHADYRITHTAVHHLLRDNVLESRRVASGMLCSLNSSYFGIEILRAEEERRQQVLQNLNVARLRKDMLKKVGTSLFILLLYGPYARNKQTPFSDMHLLFISNDAQVKKNIAHALSLIPLRVDAQVVSEKEWKDAQLGSVKDAQKHNVILHGIESHYHMK